MVHSWALVALVPLPHVLDDARVINAADIATHTDPVDRGRTSYIVRRDLTEHGMLGKYEQVWTRTDDKRFFVLCCIPFFSYGRSLGDTLEIDTPAGTHRIHAKGGHRTVG